MPRRSRSSDSQKRRFNPLLIVLGLGGGLIVVLVIALLFAKSSVESWLKGDGFRDWAVRKASVALDSKVELSELKWQDSEVFAESFRAMGYEGAGFAKLELDAVRATNGGAKGGAFSIPDVRVNRMALLFSDDRLERPEEVIQIDESGGAAASGPSVPEWAKRLIPDRVEVDQITIASTTVEAKDDAGKTRFALTGVEMEVSPNFQSDVWEIKGQGGKVFVPDQPEIRLSNLGMRWKKSDIHIDQCRLGIYDAGVIDGSGEIHLGEESAFDLHLELSSILVDDLVSDEWKPKLDGVLFGPVHITGKPGAFVYEGTLNVSDGRIESIPVLAKIAKYTKSKQFEQLNLSEAKTDFIKNGDRTELRELVLQSDGLLRIEGEVDIVGGALRGDLQVGVTPGTMRWIPGAEQKVFVESRDGFRWAPMILSGTVNDPQEDLSDRLIAAAGEAILNDLPQSLLKEAQKMLGTDGEPADTGEVIEKGRRIFDLISPFLK